MLSAPKILPWIARKAGISEELALKLWRRAASEAEFLSGRSDGPEYAGLAMERLLALVEDEVGYTPEYNMVPASRVAWMWQHQSRLSMLSLTAAQTTCQAWMSAWAQCAPRIAA